jgi:short-subunit dehydrogenase
MSYGRVVITGASSGIGAECARQLHARGAEVVLVARREERLKALSDEFNRQRPGSASYCALDLSRPSEATFAAFEQELRSTQVDILINNAGFGSFGEFADMPLERELEMIALNVVAPTRLAHAVLGQMKQRRSGALVILSSIAGFQPIPSMSTYAATKAFNLSQGLALHYEYARYGVQVLTVCPGPVETEFGGVARVPGMVTGRVRDTAEDVVKEILAALEKCKVWVVPCMSARLMSLGSRLLPRSLTTYITGKILRPVLEHVLAGGSHERKGSGGNCSES